MISPKYYVKNLLWDYPYVRRICSEICNRQIKSSSYSLSLPLIASLIHREDKDIDVKIIDETVSKINFTAAFDLVCITTNTLQAKRSFQLAEKFGKKSRVILGGPHFGNYNKEVIKEALSYADSVVIGESDHLWGKILKDFKENTLQQVYRGRTHLPDLNELILPRFDLLSLEAYLFRVLETSRGCTRRCHFCHVSSDLRFKPVDNIIEEIKYLREVEYNKRIEHRSIFFADNLLNPCANEEYVNRTKELMEKLIKYKEEKYLGDELSWDGQVDSYIGKNEKLLDLMAKSGAQRLLIGFESFYDVGKDPHRYKVKLDAARRRKGFLNTIKKVRSRGIEVIGSFIIGFDTEPDTIFDEIYEFVNESNLLLVQIFILTPYPATKLFARLRRNGKLFKDNSGKYDWDKYDCFNFVFNAGNINGKIINYIELLKRIYNNESILIRMAKREKTLLKKLRFNDLFSELLLLKNFQESIKKLGGQEDV